MPASARSITASTSAVIATASRSMTATRWSAAFTACRSARCSSAKACSTARGMPQRSRWCISSRGSRPAAIACSTPSSSPSICGPSAPTKCRGANITGMLDAALKGEGRFDALPLDQPVDGANGSQVCGRRGLSGSSAGAAAHRGCCGCCAGWRCCCGRCCCLCCGCWRCGSGASATACCPPLQSESQMS